ncbi:glycosyltransferase family 39 protein [Halomarina ordinaria]|uniref:Glycosyltransferase family 39 protein n=1 Tax=Halomarina ordinaria TaxID=3033939 RepID=A0ABD5UD75_9EURY|nr:glycosyltransferase family 39 protein [Halomarina sp. PSRA2]
MSEGVVRERGTELALALVVLVGAAVRLYGLGSESMWTDELITLEFILANGPLELLWVIPLNQPHLPVYYVLLDGWAALFGTSPVALRSLSVLFGIATIPLFYVVGRQLFSDLAGLVAAFIYALAQVQVFHAQEVRMYTLFAFLALASLSLLVRYLRTESRETAVAYVVVTVLLIYTHPFGVFAVAGEGLFVLAELARGRVRNVRRTVGTQVAVGFTVLPLVVGYFVRFDGVSLSYIPLPTPSLVVTVFTGYFARTGIVPALAYVLVLTGGLLTLAVTEGCFSASVDPRHPGRTLRNLAERIRFTDDRGVQLLVCWVFGTFVLPLVVSFTMTPVFWPRYTLAASFGLYLLVGYGVTRAKRPPVRVAIIALLLVAVVPATAFDVTTDTREQWDEATADVEQRADAEALVVVADWTTLRGFEYYQTREDLEVVGVKTGPPERRMSTPELRATMDGHDEVWVVFSHVRDEGRARVASVAGDGREVTWREHYVGIEVRRYEASTGGDDAS